MRTNDTSSTFRRLCLVNRFMGRLSCIGNIATRMNILENKGKDIANLFFLSFFFEK